MNPTKGAHPYSNKRHIETIDVWMVGQSILLVCWCMTQMVINYSRHYSFRTRRYLDNNIHCPCNLLRPKKNRTHFIYHWNVNRECVGKITHRVDMFRKRTSRANWCTALRDPLNSVASPFRIHLCQLYKPAMCHWWSNLGHKRICMSLDHLNAHKRHDHTFHMPMIVYNQPFALYNVFPANRAYNGI